MHWKHAGGRETIDRVVAHLMGAVTSCFWQGPKARLSEARYDALIKARKELPGRLAEHGLRLANDAGFNLDKALPLCGFRRSAAFLDACAIARARYREAPWRIPVDFLAGPHPLFVVHEQTGHGAPADVELVRISSMHLLGFAVVLSPRGIYALPHFFSDVVEPRLAYLWEKFGRPPAPVS